MNLDEEIKIAKEKHQRWVDIAAYLISLTEHAKKTRNDLEVYLKQVQALKKKELKREMHQAG